PLALKSSRLGIQGLDRARVVRLQTPDYQVGGTDFDWNSRYWLEFGAPWGGMLSTPEDFAVICQMLLNGGRWDGVQVLSPWMLERATTSRLDDLPDLPEPVRRAQPWGLGWQLSHPATGESWGDLLSERTFGHTGASGTMVWIDPARDGFCILFTNALRAAAP